MSKDASPDRGNIPPYVPYRTFVNFLDGLKVGVPSHIDKSVLQSYSGAMQSWLKASLRYMKLIDAQGVPQEQLYDLAHADGPMRKAELAKLFNNTYATVRSTVELETTTPAKLESAFNQLGASGETVKKCVSFMTAFAKDSGVELSPHLLKHTRATSARRTARVNRQSRHSGVDAGHTGTLDEHDPGESNAMKTILLPNAGGSLTLSGNFNLFDLSGNERELVFAIIDKMNEYQTKAEEKA